MRRVLPPFLLVTVVAVAANYTEAARIRKATALAEPPSPPPPPSPPVPPPAPADTLRVPAGGTVPAGYVAIAVRV